MAWFLRAIELDDGTWACRHGRLEYDRHERLEAALSHLHEVAASWAPEPSAIFVHPLRGSAHQLPA